MIMGVGVVKIGDNLFFQETKVTRKILLIIIAYGMFMTLNYFLIDNLLKVIFIYMCLFITYKIIYKENVSETIVSALISYLLIAIAEIIISIILGIVFKVFSLGNVLMIQNTVLINILITLVAMNLSDGLKKYTHKLVIKVGKSTGIVAIGILVLILTTISTLLTSIGVSKFEFNYTIFMNIVLIIGLVVIGIIIIKQNSNANILLKKHEELINYSKSTEKLMEQYRISNHEHKNHLIIIKSLADPNNQELQAYLDNIMKTPSGKKEFYWLNELKYLTFTGLKGFMNYKITEMIEQKIEVEINISKEVSKIKENHLEKKTRIDFYNTVGIILDNAREATLNSKEKTIMIDMYKLNKQLILEVANTYEGEIDLEKIQINGYSSKGRNRGNGLTILKKIVDGNPDISNETILRDEYFIQKIIIDL